MTRFSLLSFIDDEQQKQDLAQAYEKLAMKIKLAYKPKIISETNKTWGDFDVWADFTELEKNLWRLSCMTKNGLKWLYEFYPDFPRFRFDATSDFEQFDSLTADAFSVFGISDLDVSQHMLRCKLEPDYFASKLQTNEPFPIMRDEDSWLSENDELMMWRSFPRRMAKIWKAQQNLNDKEDR